MRYLPLFLLFISSFSLAQRSRVSSNTVFRIDSLPSDGILLNKGWKWHAGDNPEWAKTDFDDSKWESIDPTKDVMSLPESSKEGQIYWLRLPISINKSIEEQLMMVVSQSGAAEIYLNGKLIHRLGIIHKNPQQIKAFDPSYKPFSFPIKEDSIQLLSIRYALQPHVIYVTHFGYFPSIFNIRLNSIDKAVYNYSLSLTGNLNPIYFKGGVYTILCILFLALYLFFPFKKANLYFAVYNFFLAITWLISFSSSKYPIWVENIFWILNSILLLQVIGYLFKLTSVYSILEQKRGKFYYGVIILGIASMITGTFIYGWGWFLFGYALSNIVNMDIIRVAIIAGRKQKKGAWIIIVGGIIYLITWFLFCLQFFLHIDFSYLGVIHKYFFDIALLSMPVSFAIFLGYDFGITNTFLRQKLKENAALAEEKQYILTTQNETLEKQVTERTAELVHKNRDLEIEAALERVRSKTMAMQKSEEVMDVAVTLYDELQKLDFKYGASTIMIMDDLTGSMEHWVAGFDHLKYPESYHVNYFKNPCYDAQFEAWRSGQKYFVYTLAGSEKKAYDEQMFEHNDYRRFPAKEQQWMRVSESVIFSLAFMKHGALHWGPTPLSAEKASVLQRFAFVFEQSYTRFLDLQKAEVQAKEAQIEVALERVRSRTMAMFKSEELAEVATLLYRQMSQLGGLFDRFSIGIINEPKGIVEIWATDQKGNLQEKVFIAQLDEKTTIKKMYDSWKSGQQSLINSSCKLSLVLHSVR